MNRSRSRKWMGLMVCGVLGAGVAFALWPSDTKVVKKLMRGWLQDIEKSGPEPVTVAAGKQFRVASRLAADSSFEVGPPFQDRLDKEGFVGMLQYARNQVNSVRITDRGADIKRLDRGRIQVEVTLDVVVDYLNRVESLIGAYRFFWIQSDRDWRIQRIEQISVIEHPEADAFHAPHY